MMADDPTQPKGYFEHAGRTLDTYLRNRADIAKEGGGRKSHNKALDRTGRSELRTPTTRARMS